MTKHMMKVDCPFAGDTMLVEITYNFRQGRPAVMYLRNGDPGYPADPHEVEFVSVRPLAQLTFPAELQKMLDEWADLYLADDEGFERAADIALDDLVRF